MNNKQQLTREGYENIKERLRILKEEDRPRVIEALKEARAQGDLSENAEYDAAREEQAHIEKEISELETIIKNAVIIEDEGHHNNMGKWITVLYEDTNEVEEFHLVGTIEADPMEGNISSESPLGKAVLDSSVGSRCTVKTDSGIEFTVLVRNIRG